MQIKEIIISVVTILLLIGFLGVGYYLGIKDSFAMSCGLEDKVPISYKDWRFCEENSRNKDIDCYKSCLDNKINHLRIYYDIKPN